jgi:hypothetical protein|tara:strand:+ start:1230 stop:1568 length:339 start_codon:yes stop_codon:yes gene_type:complete
MSAARYNLVIDQGSDFAVNFTVNDDGSAKNLTGYSARAQMRTTKSATSVAATFVCTIPTPANGTITLALPNATSTSMAAGNYVYDLEIFTTSNAIVTRLLQGSVTLTQEVTR